MHCGEATTDLAAIERYYRDIEAVAA